ncbi:right-handed parallel beta-helix repeat-containing protein [uncultured Eubacterium sp.]|uniref:right-handed parallel beta-helix repeat-containing protein n=1 Tax=uncultured Eubacterium sp. TaxID=165185 RepID=UPI0015B842FA|nr:right-handed parallel beta-helix repeat-containing protein [uncultured Eubacterium sp.]
MKTIYASEFNIGTNEDITQGLIKLLDYLKTVDDEKTVIFDKGTYYIDSKKCKKYMLYITNTVGDKEFSKDETPHLNAVPFYFGGIDNITFDGGDSVFVIDGKVTNIAMENCKNITLKNIEIRHSHPDMHELKVLRKGLFSVDFEIDKDTQYEFINGKAYIFAKDYRYAIDHKAKNSWWIGQIRKNTPDKIKRVNHPLFSALKIKDLGNRKIRVTYPNTFRFKTGDCYYIFDVRRQFAGIFVNKCENVTLENIKQRFNYSLALVVQDSENITVEGVEFAPEKDSARKMASVADFIQICMCRGNVSIKNSYFDGAGDDSLNVHGIHFKITDIKDNQLTVRFMHPQSHGFNPLREGDTIAYINTDTLLEEGTAVIEKSELLNEYDIRLTVSNTVKAKEGNVIEDVSACPDLDFENNYMTRIITRGLLITTRGKVNVKNNHFVSTTMSGILLSDDAKSWYESGMCKDVTIENNTFDYCGQTPILIKPENRVYAGAVHKNIKLIGNTFRNYSGYCISAKDTDGVLIKKNNFSGKKIKAKNCNNISWE